MNTPRKPFPIPVRSEEEAQQTRRADLRTAQAKKISPAVVAKIQAALWLALCLPAVHLVYLTVTDNLGVNPAEFLIRKTGFWTLFILILTLAVTPLRRWTGQHWLLKYRRSLGLSAFFYACLHLTCFLWLEHAVNLDSVIVDVLDRPIIFAGMAAFALMIPLAATSTQRAMRRLGGGRWQALHRLVYLIAVFGVVHFWIHKSGKADTAEPAFYAAVLAVLLTARLFNRLQTGRW